MKTPQMREKMIQTTSTQKQQQAWQQLGQQQLEEV
jgi:hypothetical protein